MPEPESNPLKLYVNVPARAAPIVESIRQDTGVPHTEAMARLLEWFADMPRSFRTALLTKDVKDRDDLLLQWVHEQIGLGVVNDIEKITPQQDELYEKLRLKLLEMSTIMSELMKKMSKLDAAKVTKKKG